MSPSAQRQASSAADNRTGHPLARMARLPQTNEIEVETRSAVDQVLGLGGVGTAASPVSEQAEAPPDPGSVESSPTECSGTWRRRDRRSCFGRSAAASRRECIPSRPRQEHLRRS